jgi:hypothetical protein
MNDEGTAVVAAPELELSRSVDQVIKEMESVTVTTQEQYSWMEDWLRKNKDTQKVVDDFFEADRASAKAAYDAVLERKRSFKAPLEAADKVARRKMSEFATEQENRRREEQRRLDAEAKAKADDEALLKAEELSAMGRKDQADEVLEKGVKVKADQAAGKVGKLMEVWTVEVTDLCAFLAEASGLPSVAECVEVKTSALATILKKGGIEALAGVRVTKSFRPVL